MTTDVAVKRAEAADSKRWNAFVRSHVGRTAYHLYEFRWFFESTMGKRCHYFMAERKGDVVGILPIVEMRSMITGCFGVSLPFFNYGGVLAETDAVYRRLFEAASHWAQREGDIDHFELRETDARADLPVRIDKVSMRLRLPSDQNILSQRLGSKIRSQIRRPQREDSIVRIGGLDLLDDFYLVFSRNMRDLGTPVYSKKFFSEIFTIQATDSWIICVYVNGRPAAAAFLINHFDEILEIPWASAVKEYNRISVNMLLYWEALSFAIARGFPLFDFGRTTADSGPYRFKKQWGTEATQLYWHYWLANGGNPPTMNPDNPKYQMAINAWQKLPLAIANWLGPKIVRHFP